MEALIIGKLQCQSSPRGQKRILQGNMVDGSWMDFHLGLKPKLTHRNSLLQSGAPGHTENVLKVHHRPLCSFLTSMQDPEPRKRNLCENYTTLQTPQGSCDAMDDGSVSTYTKTFLLGPILVPSDWRLFRNWRIACFHYFVSSGNSMELNLGIEGWALINQQGLFKCSIGKTRGSCDDIHWLLAHWADLGWPSELLASRITFLYPCFFPGLVLRRITGWILVGC